MNTNDAEHFSFYLETLNIKMNDNVLVLTSHYYYDLNEIRNIRTLIHAKELNHVDDLPNLMSNMMKGLSKNTQVIGCFIDNKLRYKGKLGYWLSHFTELKDNNYLSRKHVIKLFIKYGLHIVDITEIGGITYFCIKR